MRILRSAMDEAHENLQSKDGPIQFLHDRSTFYELAAILVEGGLNIVQEETTDILEDNCNKILSDLMEIRDWLQGRIQDMKRLIVEKDREFTERLENELKLQQSLELKDREIFYLHEKLEPGRAKHEAIQDGATERDISKLKSSVDQQIWREMEVRFSRIYDSLVTDRFSDVKPQSELSRPNNQNVLIRRMSSDMDILKETLDLAFGRMLSAEALPLEKQWMCTIEKDIESILVKGFINDLKQSFDVELKKKVDSWFEFIDEMRTLCYELKDYFTINDVHEKGSITPGSSNRFTTERRWSSEPLPEFSYTKNPIEDDTEVEKSNHVAKMIKNHESIIRKQLEDWNLLKREGSMSSWIRRDKGNNRLEKRIQEAITRLDNFTKRNHNLAGQTCLSNRNLVQRKSRIPRSDIRISSSCSKIESLEVEIEKLQEQRDSLFFQISMIEDTYQVLLRGIMKDFSTEFCYEEFSLESTIREDLYVVFFRETVKQWKNFIEECFVKEKRKQIASDNLTLRESIGSLLKEDIYMVFFREMAEAWNFEKDACAFENLIREDIYQFVVIEGVKDSHVHLMESESLKQHDFQERTPRSRRLNADNSQEGTPRSRKLETEGDESLIQKLDSLLRCLEAEEDLMLRASSEIKEHNVNNSLVILNCEEIDERNAIEWLITDDESTFSSVSEKLERALQQLYTSKELLVELEQSLEVSDDELGENCCQMQLNNVLSTEHEKTYSLKDDQMRQVVPSDYVLAIIMQFQQALGNVEQVLHENLESKCLRLEVLKHQVDALTEPVALIRTRKLLYKKAFLSRCHNLKLAETEVDLLGDQVESLLCLLERIYVELNQNATLFSGYFKVYDILKLIKREFNNAGRSCKTNSD
ncbi:hypothetical protein DH2020_021662 [Rehmannia glutinosa]|uniref:WPP domain-associated protein n=1 Tax=Rehmannia glutinosa TaxID=99300 RepID=A0ABR0WB46_REHGL